jgi:iron complex outermembrane receptor protein
MIRRHWNNLARLSFVGAVLACQATRAEESLEFWLNATADPAVTPADFITSQLEIPAAAPVTYLDPRQVFEDIDRQQLAPPTAPTAADAPEPMYGGGAQTLSQDEIGQVGSSLRSGEIINSGTPPDAAQALQQSNTARGVNVQRRSAVAFDPRVRSYRIGQVYTEADGMYFLPVRTDLDTILSKTDPSLIDQINVIKGPYSLRYGPGFSFIDVVTSFTPRYEDCYEVHSRSGYTFHANGSRHYARETVYGGDSDYGYIFSYGYRNGADYDSGSSAAPPIPGSYKAHNVLAQVGFDLAADSRVEMRYQRLDQSDTQYPGQFFDVDQLQTDLYQMTFVDEDSCNPWTRLYAVGYYHRTPMFGTVRNEPYFNVQDRVETALESAFGSGPVTFNGQTAGRIGIAGGKVMTTFGEEEDTRLHTGVDIRHYNQNINETFQVVDAGNPFNNFGVSTNLPQSEFTNPGLFAELEQPLTDYWSARLGGRVDYVYTTAFGVDPNNTSFPQGDQDLKQGDTLYSFYLMNDVELNSEWTVSGGFGHAQRPPTLIERYSDGIFLGVLQSGFSRVIGDPNLRPERNWQFDASVTAEYEYTRGQVGAFYAIIDDFVTYRGALVNDPTGARLLRYINISQATLMGFEAYGEHDIDDNWTLFAAAQFVRGTDDDIHAPLYAIPPLDTRLGLRLHDADGGRVWNVEFAGRFVDSQDRIGLLRLGNGFTPDTLVPAESPTWAFATLDIRGYWTPREGLNFIGGIENVTDTAYLEHLDLRLPNNTIGGTNFNAAYAFAPGFTPYLGVEYTY